MSVAGEHRRVLDLFGSRVEIYVGNGHEAGGLGPAAAAVQAEAFLRGVHRELSRFDPESALSALNADPRPTRQVTPLLALAIDAALRAAAGSDGLVDPTQLPELERAGYATSRVGAPSAPLSDALREAPERRAARPDPAARWRGIRLEPGADVVSRPPGMRIDLGGSAKGLAADLAGARLAGHASFAIDAGGDLRIGGTSGAPRQVGVEHPFGGPPAHRFEVVSGAVATSGIGTRVWRTPGGFAHHLIDPSSGHPAWTGIVQATALAPTAVEAEGLAKAALLSGPAAAGHWLAGGGVVVLDDGDVVVHGVPAHELEASAA